MIGKRGIRRTSTRVRLAVAAAVLVGGGAAAVVAVAANNGNTATAQSAGYYTPTGRSMSYTSAMSSAMSSWNYSSNTSLTTMSHMSPMRTFDTMSWHHTTIAMQRGTVVGESRSELAVKSSNGTLEVWHVNGGTKTLNVGGSSTGMSAMTGGTMNVPSSWQMNTTVKGVAKSDVVFVFGEKENHTLKAQLVLFAAPMTTRTTPDRTPASTATPTSTATTPAATTTTPAATNTTPASTVTSSAPAFSGHNS